VYYIDAASQTVARWEWVSYSADPADPADMAGGAFDDNVQALASTGAGLLIAGTPSTLNVQYLNASIFRVDCRVGLPYAAVLAVSADGADAGAAWVGHAGGGATRWDAARGAFKYFYGPRYLPGNTVFAIASWGNSTVLATDGGLAVITAESWTLAAKAGLMESIVPRHNREGLIGGCDFSAFGDLPSCTCHDDDNNGLWSRCVALLPPPLPDNHHCHHRRRRCAGMNPLTVWGVCCVPARCAHAA
jgi:hypothetical protein